MAECLDCPDPIGGCPNREDCQSSFRVIGVPVTPTAAEDWFERIWDALDASERDEVRSKAKWEHVTLRGVLVDWPSYAPESLRHLVPKPNRDP